MSFANRELDYELKKEIKFVIIKKLKQINYYNFIS